MKNKGYGWCLATLFAVLPAAEAVALSPGESARIGGCAQAATLEQRIDLTPGVHTEQAVAAAPLSITLHAGLSAERFHDCLRREGLDAGTTAVAAFERAGECGRRAGGPVRLVPGDAVRLVRTPDQAARRRCLERGLEAEVISTGG